jgi:pyruvate,orthophosphate dikinase
MAVQKITQVRSEYTSARLILSNLEHRIAGTRFQRQPGYLPAEIDSTTSDGTPTTIIVRDYDVRYLDRVSSATAIEHVDLIHRARHGGLAARQELVRRTRDAYQKIFPRFAGTALIENEHVIPYTTSGTFSETEISNKGSILLNLSRCGLATADFNLLAARAYLLPMAAREKCVRETIHNLEILSGRKLEDPENPLLIAMRTAVPEYIPGFMPTYLNVGLTPDMFPGLPRRYGREAAARIRLSNRKTLLEALDPESFRSMEKEIQPYLSIKQNHELASRIEAIIEKRNPQLLTSAYDQIQFFVSKAYDYYESHIEALRNFMVRETHYPAVIFQRMVCSVIDKWSYPGVLYSRHPRLGSGVFFQYARTVFGEDLMTGRLRPEERHFKSREEAKKDFPAVYHFWPRLSQLEEIFHAPVMVEFTGVHGTFTILQVNPAEMSGAGMLTAVMDMHLAGKIPAERVRELIKPYHVRQIESDAIDPKSLHTLIPFCRGISVLPRSAVTGRVYFSAARAEQAREEQASTNVILTKERFTPTDAIDMQKVSGICSLSPAAIHVVTAAQNLGIPALLNLEGSGVCIDHEQDVIVNRDGLTVREGDWITISSRFRTLYIGKAVYAPARLLRFMAGEKVDLSPSEKVRFKALAVYYREYRRILESVDASNFESLQDLGHAIRYGRLQKDSQTAAVFVNLCFDVNQEKLVRRLLDATLGTHLVNMAAYELLTPDRQIKLLKAALGICLGKGISGYQAGAFIIGSLVKPGSRVAFWQCFRPLEIAMLMNEWVLYQKYLNIMNDLGERKISRAKDYILSRGLGSLRIHKGLVSDFMTLKLSGADLNEARRQVTAMFDPQTTGVLDLLLRPYAEFFDFADPKSFSALQRICEAEGVRLPAPTDI